MTLKSVIDIDVDDSKFARFQELFKRYNEQLSKMPSAWKDSSKESKAMATHFDRMASALMAQAHLSRETTNAQREQEKYLTRSERLWVSMSNATKDVARNIIGATGALLRWSGLIGAVSGLLGAGGLWGIDRMAAGVSGQRRSAMGLGMSIGQQQAFEVNLGRFVNPGAFLGGIGAAVADISKQGPLYALGVNPNGSTSRVAIATLRALRARALATPVNQLGILEKQYRLGDIGIGTEDLRRLRAATPQEFNAQLAHYRSDVGALGLGDKTALQWQNFSTQMQRAGETIFKTFVTGLTPLVPALTKLSSAFTKFLGVLLSSPLIKKGLDDIAHWLDNFAGTISAPAFLKSVQGFVSDVGALADAIHAVAHPFDTVTGWGAKLGGALFGAFHPDADYKAGDKKKYSQFLANMDLAYGLPAGMLEKQWAAESSSRFNPPDSAKGAVGPFQFLPNTAAQYGIDPRDPQSAALGAALYDQYLMKKYHGDVVKAVAAYNYGEGNVDKAIHKYHAAWMQHLPKETLGYLGKNMNVSVHFHNAPGTSAQVTASALSPGF